MTEKIIKKEDKCILIGIFITLITQAPQLLEYNNYFKIILISIWFFLLTRNILKNKIYINKNFIKKMIVLFLFNIFILVCSIFEISYLKSIHFSSINIAMLFYLVGYTTNNENSKDLIYRISKIFIITILLISVTIYSEYMQNKDILSTSKYMYSSKNSIGLLVAFAIILMDNYNIDKNKILILRLLKLWFIVFVLLLQNRTSIVILGLYYLLFFITKKITLRWYDIIFLSIGFVLIFYNKEGLSDFFNWSLRLGTSSNINDLSSGRITLIRSAIESFNSNTWLGIPSYYIDNSLICLLAEYGIIGFSIVITMYIIIILDFIKYFKRKNYLTSSIILVGIVASMFEALPPFGPGAVFCIFWFIYGLEDKKK